MAVKKDAEYWKKYRAKKKVAQPDATEIEKLCNQVATLMEQMMSLQLRVAELEKGIQPLQAVGKAIDEATAAFLEGHPMGTGEWSTVTGWMDYPSLEWHQER